MKSSASPDFQSEARLPLPHLWGLACFAWMHRCCAGRSHTYASVAGCTQGLFMARTRLGSPVMNFHFIIAAPGDGRLRMNCTACVSEVIFSTCSFKALMCPCDGMRCCCDGIFEFWIMQFWISYGTLFRDLLLNISWRVQISFECRLYFLILHFNSNIK